MDREAWDSYRQSETESITEMEWDEKDALAEDNNKQHDTVQSIEGADGHGLQLGR